MHTKNLLRHCNKIDKVISLQYLKFSFVIVLFAFSFIAIFRPGFENEDLLSFESLKHFKSLNQKNNFSVQAMATKPFLNENDIFADVINPPSKDTYKGLIVSFNKSADPNDFLLLEPFTPLTDEELEKVAKQYIETIPEIDNVEIDQPLQISEIAEPDWIGDVFSKSNTKNAALDSQPQEKPVKVAVIDTGIDTNHEIFEDVQIAEGWNSIDDNGIVFDDIGHGTHVTGIVVSNSANTIIFPYKVVNKDQGRLSHVLKALFKAHDDEVDIISMSFGFSSDSLSLKSVMKEIYEDGIITVAAAGNKGTSDPFYPAFYDTVIAVGSTDEYGNKLPTSNYGDWVDIAANGNRIYSSIPNNKYKYMTGTSQSTAYISAELVDFVRNSNLKSALKNTDLIKSYLTEKAS